MMEQRKGNDANSAGLNTAGALTCGTSSSDSRRKDFLAIKGAYDRLVKVFGTDEIIVVGGTALKLTSDLDRPMHDLDATMLPARLRGISERKLEENDFDGLYEDDRLVLLTDKKTSLEIEVSSKNCGTLNQRLGLPEFTEESPTVLGLPTSSVIASSITVDVLGTKVRVPCPLHQVMMKYNLWLFRGNGKTKDQKDAQDIRKIVGFYYGTAEDAIRKECAGIKAECRARSFDAFCSDIRKIMSA